jgi:predicted transcriptional regulator
MVRMAQTIQAIGGGINEVQPRPVTALPRPNPQGDEPQDRMQEAAVQGLGFTTAILAALGDESSRKILTSAIASGKTVEEISAEQDLPLSTCYRRMRGLLRCGLVILERTVITPAGKRYAVYRTSFSRAKIAYNSGEIAVELTPNMEIIDKLRRKWLAENYPMQNEYDDRRERASVFPSLNTSSSGPFE